MPAEAAADMQVMCTQTPGLAPWLRLAAMSACESEHCAVGTVVASGLADCGNGWLNRQLRFLQGVERSARVLQAAPQPQGYRIVWASGCERSGAAAASVPAALATLSSPPLLQMQVALVAFAGGHQKGMARIAQAMAFLPSIGTGLGHRMARARPLAHEP